MSGAGPNVTQLTDTVVAFLNSAEFAARIPVGGLAGLLGGRTIEAFMDAPPGDRLVACLGRADVVAAIVAKGNQLRDLRRFCRPLPPPAPWALSLPCCCRCPSSCLRQSIIVPFTPSPSSYAFIPPLLLPVVPRAGGALGAQALAPVQGMLGVALKPVRVAFAPRCATGSVPVPAALRRCSLFSPPRCFACVRCVTWVHAPPALLPPGILNPLWHNIPT